MVSKGVMVIKIANAFWCKNIYALSNKNVSILFFWLINNGPRLCPPFIRDTLPPGLTPHSDLFECMPRASSINILFIVSMISISL